MSDVPGSRHIRKFNPGMSQSDEDVIAQFVVRNREFETVMDVLRGNIDSISCQHILLIGPRGRGKTMLLARVAAELRTDDMLSQQLLPIRFMEESHEIFDAGDFWLETLFYLARELSLIDPDLSRELKDVHAALASEWRGREVEERARAAVLEAADRLRVQLVLMVENLQALCGQADQDFGWKLRGTLQSEPKIVLLATATRRFKGIDDANEPFFEMFRTFRLAPLDTEECRRLWRIVSGDAVSSREIRPLEILTGGSPRLLVTVAEFARHRSGGLVEELWRLIDHHTEYFRGHLERFSKTERRVYLAVVDLWQPSGTGEIAERARMDVRAVSALLGRLVQRGALIVEGNRRNKRMYMAAERLYSIYYKLRRERDEAAGICNLFHFMAVFYTDSEMPTRTRSGVEESSTIRQGIKQSVTDLPGTGDTDVQIAETLLQQGIALGQIGNSRAEIATYDGLVKRFDGSNVTGVQIQIAKALFHKGVTLARIDNPHASIAAYDEVVERFPDSDVPEIRLQVAASIANKAEGEIGLGRAEQALSVCDELERRVGALSEDRQPTVARRAKWLKTEALLMLSRRPHAMDEFRAGYALFQSDNGTIVHEMLANVPKLIAAGAREHDLVEILSTDGEMAEKLLPLVVALHQRAGETVRAPAEVHEVATDISAMIAEWG